MGRALRRRQERAARRQQRDSGGGGRRTMSVSAPAAEGRPGGRRFVPRWITDIASELRKVTWPSRGEIAT